MNRSSTTLASFAGMGILTSAVIALAQTPPDSPPRNPPPTPPSQNPPSQNPPRTPPSDRVPQAGAAAGYMQTPKYAQRLDSTLSENGIQVCADNDFRGDQALIDGVTKSHRTGTLNELPANFDDSITSLRWNLAPGVLVVLFEDASGEGQQLALWGKGQVPDLGKVDFNETASRWAWYDVGGGNGSRSAANVALPHGAQPLAGAVPVGALHTFDDQNFMTDEQHVAGIFGMKAGDWHEFPGGKENGASSLRWNLPEGMIVILAAEDGGNDNIILFGEGQNPDLSVCGFNNRASRWSWAFIGSPIDKPDHDRESDGMTPREP